MKLAHALIFAASLPVTAPAVAAAPAVALSSQIKVERTVTANGQTRTELLDPKVVVPGDRLLITISYKNASGKPVTDFAVTNPVPASLRFTGQASPGALVSVDSGRVFGPLAAQKVRQGDGAMRAAQPGDVTHLRWVLAQAIPAGGSGMLSFYGTVR